MKIISSTEPLANAISINMLTSDKFTGFLDELTVQTVSTLQIADLTPKTCLHENNGRFIYFLKALRDILKNVA
jgi:hypothetical protein